MSSFDSLVQAVGGASTLEQAVTTLVEGLAERIKSTSNDQNVQRLARELRAAAPVFVEATAPKQPA